MRILIALIAFFALTPLAQAQEFFVFPNEGQSQDQQDKDEFQCIRIARDRTGFDPMATPTATTRAANLMMGGHTSTLTRRSSSVREPGCF